MNMNAMHCARDCFKMQEDSYLHWQRGQQGRVLFQEGAIIRVKCTCELLKSLNGHKMWWSCVLQHQFQVPKNSWLHGDEGRLLRGAMVVPSPRAALPVDCIDSRAAPPQSTHGPGIVTTGSRDGRRVETC